MNAAHPGLPGLSLCMCYWYILIFFSLSVAVNHLSVCLPSLVFEVTQGWCLSSSGRQVWRNEMEEREERGWNLAEVNEASLTVANWCFNLWLWLSWCLSLPVGRLMGTRAEQTFCLPTFIFTIPSLLTHKKQYLLSISLTGASQTNTILPSQCQNSGKVNRGALETVRN